MRNPALAFGLAFTAMFAFAAMTRPPVEQLVEGQQQCSNGTAVCMGDKKRAVRLQGPVSFESQVTPAPNPWTLNPDAGIGSIAPGNNYIASSSKALINYDFPALASVAGSFNQADSSTATIANCPLGSGLMLGVDQAVTGGLVLTPLLSAANTAFVRATLGVLDAGSVNMPDASYIVRCIP